MVDLFVRIDVDVALDAFLAGVGPAVARHPLPLAARTLVLAETALLALVRRHRVRPRPCHTLHAHTPSQYDRYNTAQTVR